MTNQPHHTNPAGFPVYISGHGMVLEWKRGYDNKPKCWWLRDEQQVPKEESQTYQHYKTLKTTPKARWSRNFHAWYYTGGAIPPETWLTMVGYEPDTADATPQQPADDDGLDLIPDWLIAMMQQDVQAQTSTRSEDRQIYAKLFTPDADLYVFIHKYRPRYREVYGYAILNGDLEMAEWGWQPIEALQAVRGRMGLPMERDICFKPKPLKDALQDWKRGRGYPIEADEQPASRSPFPPEISQQIEDILAVDDAREQRERDRAAVYATRQARAAAMQAYREFQAVQQLQRRFTEHLHHLTTRKALPAISTPPLDDPWS